MDKTEFIKKLRSMRCGLVSIPEEFKDDYDVALEAIKHNGGFHELGENLRKNKEIILLAAKYDSRVLYWAADDELKKDKEFLLEYAKNGGSLSYADPEIRDNEEFMIEAIKISGNAFSGASDRLRSDKQFIKKAVSESGKFKSEIALVWRDETFYDTSILDLLKAEIRDDKEFMKELKEIEEAKQKSKKSETHNISEIEDAIFDRKSKDINKVVAEISEEMKDKSIENEQTKGN